MATPSSRHGSCCSSSAPTCRGVASTSTRRSARPDVRRAGRPDARHARPAAPADRPTRRSARPAHRRDRRAHTGDRDHRRQGTATLQALASRETQLSSVLAQPPWPDGLDSQHDGRDRLGQRPSDTRRHQPRRGDGGTPPRVAALAPAARDGRTIVASLRDAIPSLNSLLGAAPGAIGYPGTGTTGVLSDLTPIRSTFCQLNPALTYLKPYTQDFWSIIPHLGSSSNPYDAIGHIVRLVPIINENSLSGAPPDRAGRPRAPYLPACSYPTRSSASTRTRSRAPSARISPTSAIRARPPNSTRPTCIPAFTRLADHARRSLLG